MRLNGLKYITIIISFTALILSVPAYAASTIQSTICPRKPTITSPNNGITTASASINVLGTAENSAEITMLNNGQTAGSVQTGSNGTFGLQVNLSVGSNQLIASDFNPCNNLVESSTVTIIRTVPVSTSSNTTKTTTSSRNANTANTANTTNTTQPTATSSNTISFQAQDGITVSSSDYWLHGTAPAGQLVTISLNGAVVAHVYAASDGTFAAELSLKEGSNNIQAELADGTKSNLTVVLRVKNSAPIKTSFDWKWISVIAGIAVIAILVLLGLLLLAKRRIGGQSGY